MSYIVSARKYRPGTFEDVVGQEQITATLKRSIETDHIAQAFLFCGPRGVGKTTCARIMAKAVNTGKTTQLDEIHEDFSFNIFELDAASNNGVEDMHQLIAQVRIPPQNGKYKIYIIDEVHMLSKSAFNAFLKTLEEPPPYAIFILATTEKHKILPTILSRCQIYDFKRIKVGDIVNHLKNIAQKEGIQADDSALHIIAEKADGALRDALSIFDRLVSFTGNELTYESAVKNLNILDYDYFFTITNALLASDLSSAFLSLDEIINNGFEGDHFVNGLSGHFRNLMVAKDPKTHSLLELSDQAKAKYIAQANLCSNQFLVNGLSLCADTDVQYAMALNKRLLVETLLMKLAYLSNAFEGKLLESSNEKKNLSKQADSISTNSIAKEKKTEASPLNEQTKKTEEDALPSSQAIPKVKKSISLSLDDLEKQVEQELASPNTTKQDTTEQIEDKTIKGELALTDENLKTAWSSLLSFLEEKELKSLVELINDKKPTIHENNIQLIADSEIEKKLIIKEKQTIARFLHSQFDINDIKLTVIVEANEEKQKVILNQKDKFLRMAQQNPYLKELKEKLDLELEL